MRSAVLLSFARGFGGDTLSEDPRGSDKHPDPGRELLATLFHLVDPAVRLWVPWAYEHAKRRPPSIRRVVHDHFSAVDAARTLAAARPQAAGELGHITAWAHRAAALSARASSQSPRAADAVLGSAEAAGRTLALIGVFVEDPEASVRRAATLLGYRPDAPEIGRVPRAIRYSTATPRGLTTRAS